MSDELFESPITKIMLLLLAFFLFSIGVYIIYAVIANKPLADPNNPSNFIANLPFWSKELHKTKLFVIGCVTTVFFLICIIKYISELIIKE